MLEKFYCLSWDGNLYALGGHIAWYDAEYTTLKRGLDPVWIFGEESFNEWRETLNNFAEKGI